MLILQRKAGSSFKIGDNITVSVISVEKGKVSLAIDAPSEISIMRTELLEARKANQEAVISKTDANEMLMFLENAVDSHSNKL